MSLSRGGSGSTCSSPTKIFPLEANSNPATSLKSVVFPQPEGPSSTQNSPSLTSNETSSSMLVWLNDLETLRTESDAIGVNYFFGSNSSSRSSGSNRWNG